MSTPPLLNLPTSACAASVTMSLTRVVAVSQSPFTLEEQSFKWPGEVWAMDFQLPPITSREVASDWITFLAKLQGKYGRFLAGDPAAKSPRGIATGTPLVNGANQVGDSINVDGFTAGVTGIMLKGDYIQLGTGDESRLHMVVEDANSNGSGEATLQIVPDIVQAPGDNTAVVVNNPVGTFRLVENTVSWLVLPGSLYRLSFQAVGVVSA